MQSNSDFIKKARVAKLKMSINKENLTQRNCKVVTKFGRGMMTKQY